MGCSLTHLVVTELDLVGALWSTFSGVVEYDAESAPGHKTCGGKQGSRHPLGGRTGRRTRAALARGGRQCQGREREKYVLSKHNQWLRRQLVDVPQRSRACHVSWTNCQIGSCQV